MLPNEAVHLEGGGSGDKSNDRGRMQFGERTMEAEGKRMENSEGGSCRAIPACDGQTSAANCVQTSSPPKTSDILHGLQKDAQDCEEVQRQEQLHKAAHTNRAGWMRIPEDGRVKRMNSEDINFESSLHAHRRSDPFHRCLVHRPALSSRDHSISQPAGRYTGSRTDSNDSLGE